MRFGLFKNRTRKPVPIVYQYWDNNPPPDIASWMRTWEGVEPGFKLEQFDDSAARKFIADRIGAEAEAAYLQCRAPAMKSDFFRYCALYATGGVYVDAGTSYRSGLEDLFVKGDRGVLLRRTKGPGVKLINGFMIAKRPADPLMEFAIRSAVANIRNRKSQSVWDVTGPGILRRAYASELQSELFSGFEILDMHSAPVSRVFVLLRREHKSGPFDWRRMLQTSETIYSDDPDVQDTRDGHKPTSGTAHVTESGKHSQQQKSAPGRKLAFLHIPKSGGVSIEQVLKKQFRSQEIAPYYFPHEYAKIDASVDPCSFGLIIGHFDYDLVRRLDRTFVKAVMFREPLQLVVSLYNHAASRPAHRLHTAISSGDLPFEKFCRTGGASNILSKYLLGRSTYFELVANAMNERIIEKGIATARRHLAEFDCIGVLDEIGRFGRMLSSATGIDMSEIPKLNSSESKRVAINELTPAERCSLETANRLDLAIYEAVKRSYDAGDWRLGKEVLS